MANDFNNTEVKDTSDGRGNGLFSKVQAEPGEELMRINSPLVAIPDSEALETVCYQCFLDSSLADLKKCTGCNNVSYCSKPCQRDSWKLIHKLECKQLKDAQRGRNIINRLKERCLPTQARAAIQILLKNKNMIEKHPEDKSWQQVGLVDHFAEIKAKDPKRLEAAMMECLAAKEYSNVEVEINALLLLFFRMQMNTFTLQQGDMTPIGICFSPTLSAANHSCMANAYVMFIGRRLSLRAMSAVQPGDELTISYIDPTYPKATRQRELKHYFFTCTCEKCIFDYDNYTAVTKTPSPYNTPQIREDQSSISTSLLTPLETEILVKQGMDFINNPANKPILTKLYDLVPLNVSGISLPIPLPPLGALLSRPIVAAIQPLSVHLHGLYLRHLTGNCILPNYIPALSAMLFLIFYSDPILHPYHHDPIRVIHIYTAAKMLHELLYWEKVEPKKLQTQIQASEYLGVSGKSKTKLQELFKKMDLEKCGFTLWIYLDGVVDMSYGPDSRWAKETREILADFGKTDRFIFGARYTRKCLDELRELADCCGEVWNALV